MATLIWINPQMMQLGIVGLPEILNGSFEAPTTTTTSATVTGWTVTGQSAGVAKNNNTSFIIPSNAVVDGTQCLYVQSAFYNAASASTTITNMVVGTYYTISFCMTFRNTATTMTPTTLTVTINGTTVLTVPTYNITSVWQKYTTIPFIITTGSTATLVFALAPAADSTLFFDQVTISTAVAPVTSIVDMPWIVGVDSTGTDNAFGVDADSVGNVYLCGQKGVAIANIYTTGYNTTPLTIPFTTTTGYIVKYDALGKVLHRMYVDNASTSTDSIQCVRCDANNNVYALVTISAAGTVTIYGAANQTPLTTLSNALTALVKYDSNGVPIWRAQFNATIGDYYMIATFGDYVYVAFLVNAAAPQSIRNSSNVVAGTTTDIASTGTNFCVVQYTSSGNVNWFYTFISSVTDRIYALEADSTGVYIAGQGTGGATTMNAYLNGSSTIAFTLNEAIAGTLIKLNHDNSLNYTARITSGSSITAGGTALDTINNAIYISGNAGNTITIFNPNNATSLTSTIGNAPGNIPWIVKRNSTNGIAEWRTYFNITTFNLLNMVTDNQGNLYIVINRPANSSGAINNSALAISATMFIPATLYSGHSIIKYNSAGTPLWYAYTNYLTTNSVGITTTKNTLSSDGTNIFLALTNPANAEGYFITADVNGEIDTQPLPVSTTISSSVLRITGDGFLRQSPTFYRRYPPINIPSGSWTGTAPSFSYTVSGQSYGNGIYNITSTATTDASGLFDGVLASGTPSFAFTTVPTSVQIQLPEETILRKYIINPLHGSTGPTSWTVQASNDGSTWTTLDTVTATLTNTQLIGCPRLLANNTVPYTFYMFTFTAPSATSLFIKQIRLYSQQINEIYLTYPPTALTSNATTITTTSYGNGLYTTSASNTLTAWDPWRAFDRLTTSGWATTANRYSGGTPAVYTASTNIATTPNFPNGDWLQIVLPYSIVLVSYVLRARNDVDYTQAPSSFKVLGSLNGSTWTEVDNESGITWTQGEVKTFYVPTTSSTNYIYYRLLVTAIATQNSSGSCSVMEWQLTGSQSQGLVAFYDFNNASSYSGTGNTLYDISGNNNTITLTSAGVFNTSPKSITTTASTYGIDNTVPSFSPTSFTLECLIRFTSAIGSPRSSLLTLTGSNGTLSLYVNNNGSLGLVNTTITNANAILVNQWYHIALSYNSSNNFTLYLNSLETTLTTTTVAIGSSYTSLILANSVSPFTSGFIGNLALARVYNRALSSREVIENYIECQSLPGNPTSLSTLTSLEAHYDFNSTASYSGSGSTVVNDLSGKSGRNLTFTSGAPTFNASPRYISMVPTLDAVSSALTIAYASLGLTMEALVWRDPTCGTFVSYFTIDSGLWQDSYRHNVSGTLTIYYFGPADQQVLYTNRAPAITMNESTWYHVVYTFTPWENDTVTGRCYINGVQCGTDQVMTPASTTFKFPLVDTSKSFRIGRPSNYNGFTGRFAMGRVYSKRLTAAEVLANFNAIRNISGNPYQLNTEYPPIAMTANTTAISSQPYGNGSYTASSSTNFSTNTAAFAPFKKTLLGLVSGTQNIWASGTASAYTGTGGLYNGVITTTVSGASISGEWIQIQLPSSISLRSYEISNTSESPSGGNSSESPANWTLAGSTNGSTWELIQTVTGATFASSLSSLTYSNINSLSYTYFRFIIRKRLVAGNYVSISNLRLYSA